MELILTSPGEWVVAENGHMTYYLDNKLIFELEPEKIFQKDLYSVISVMPDMNKDYFYIKWIEALEKAKYVEVTIKIPF